MARESSNGTRHRDQTNPLSQPPRAAASGRARRAVDGGVGGSPYFCGCSDFFCGRRGPPHCGSHPRDADALRSTLESLLSVENLQVDSYLRGRRRKALRALAVLARCDRPVALGAAPPAIAEAARASTALRLDPSGTMAKPDVADKRNTLLLRDVPPEAQAEEVRALFDAEGCPAPAELRAEAGGSWVVRFAEEEQCLDAVGVLRGARCAAPRSRRGEGRGPAANRSAAAHPAPSQPSAAPAADDLAGAEPLRIAATAPAGARRAGRRRRRQASKSMCASGAARRRRRAGAGTLLRRRNNRRAPSSLRNYMAADEQNAAAAEAAAAHARPLVAPPLSATAQQANRARGFGGAVGRPLVLELINGPRAAAASRPPRYATMADEGEKSGGRRAGSETRAAAVARRPAAARSGRRRRRRQPPPHLIGRELPLLEEGEGGGAVGATDETSNRRQRLRRATDGAEGERVERARFVDDTFENNARAPCR